MSTKPNPFADQNPYAPPAIMAEQMPFAPSGYNDGLWRDGKVLVMRIGAPLPARCVKSNEPTTRFLKRNLAWAPSWVYLTLLLNVIVCLIIVLIVQKKATINIGLSEEWLARRRQRMLIAWGLVGVAVMMFIGGILLIDTYEPAAIMLGIGPLVGLGGAIYGAVAARMVSAKKIDDRFAWVKGICPEYLSELPPWPGTR